MIVSTLVRALANLVVSIELAEDDDIDPQLAAELIDDLLTDLEDLSAEDRHRVLAELHAMVAAEHDTERKSLLIDLPDELGLEEE
jgi:hypothetical protein